MEQNQDFTLIREWASERGIYSNGDVKTQYIKLMEEAGELGRAILKEDDHEFEDAIGDMVVVLTNLAHLGGTTIEHCITGAWQEIKNRKGKMSNGTFVKDIEVVVEREFMCIGLVEIKCGNWEEFFTVGNVYKEKRPENPLDTYPGVLFLSNGEHEFYVDEDQFDIYNGL